jgi:hypothetical protein
VTTQCRNAKCENFTVWCTCSQGLPCPLVPTHRSMTTGGDNISEISSALRPTPPAEGISWRCRSSIHRIPTWLKHLNMRSAIQAALLRVQQHTQLRNGNGTPELSATALQVCSRSSVLSSAGVSVRDGTHGGVSPNTHLALQLIDKPNLRGTINALMRLIEQHGLEELQRFGVLSPEGSMQGLQTRRGDVSLTRLQRRAHRNSLRSLILTVSPSTLPCLRITTGTQEKKVEHRLAWTSWHRAHMQTQQCRYGTTR